MKTLSQLIILLLCLIISLTAAAQCLSGDCINGLGTFKFDKIIYNGTFYEGVVNGIGTATFPNGITYKGEWKNRIPHGKGNYLQNDILVWEGKWHEGVPLDFFGNKMTSRELKNNHIQNLNEPFQMGCVFGDCLNGKGVYGYADGSLYKGDFKNSLPDGNGKMVYYYKEVYEGAFLKGLPNGVGLFQDLENGISKKGTWEMGEFTGELFGKNGTPEGCIEGDCNSGIGTYVFAEGKAKYNGEFQNYKPHGNGICYYSNGDLYKGQWENGTFHGVGKFSTPAGIAVSGIWRNGDYIGSEAELLTYNQTTTPQKPTEKPILEEEIINETKVADIVKREEALKSDTLVLTNELGQVPNTLLKEHQESDVLKKESEKEFVVSTKTQTQVLQNQQLRKTIESGADKVLPKVWAVVIGISSYKHMPALKYSDDDAYRMANFLQQPAGGALPDEQIELLIDENATKNNILTTLEKTFLKAGPKDLVIVYYSGHGLKGSFLPIDYDGKNKIIEHIEIQEIMNETESENKLFIADACHSGSFASKGVLQEYFYTLAVSDSLSAGSAFMLSSKSEEISVESSGLRQGVFSHFLIRGLKGEADLDLNGDITINELFRFVNNHVRTYTANQQSPQIYGEYNPDMVILRRN